MGITAQEFTFIQRLVQEESAIILGEGKDYLVESRLEQLAMKEGFESFSTLIKKLKECSTRDLQSKVIDAMTTNETSFYRDFYPYQILEKTLIPAILESGAATRRLVIWSAACSSGQEPYSIALMLREKFRELLTWDVKIIASDISEEMLEKTREGAYNQLEVNRGLPASLLVKYFSQEGSKWQVRKDIRDMLELKQINLARVFPVFSQLDVVFLRNVLIYFDVEMKKQILSNIHQVLKPGGTLFLGGSETTLNLNEGFERVAGDRGSYYRKI